MVGVRGGARVWVWVMPLSVRPFRRVRIGNDAFSCRALISLRTGLGSAGIEVVPSTLSAVIPGLVPGDLCPAAREVQAVRQRTVLLHLRLKRGPGHKARDDGSIRGAVATLWITSAYCFRPRHPEGAGLNETLSALTAFLRLFQPDPGPRLEGPEGLPAAAALLPTSGPWPGTARPVGGVPAALGAGRGPRTT